MLCASALYKDDIPAEEMRDVVPNSFLTFSKHFLTSWCLTDVTTDKNALQKHSRTGVTIHFWTVLFVSGATEHLQRASVRLRGPHW